MSNPRGRTVTVSARVTAVDRALIDAAAAAEGVLVSEWLTRLVVPEARRRLSRELAGQGSPGGPVVL